MWRWIIGGVAAAALYSLVAGSIYSRARWAYDREWNDANYRVADAEELRREAAQKLMISEGEPQLRPHGKPVDYTKDPAYRAAEAKVEAATDSYPDDRAVMRLRSDEIRYGEWGGGAYVVILLAVALRRRVVH